MHTFVDALRRFPDAVGSEERQFLARLRQLLYENDDFQSLDDPYNLSIEKLASIYDSVLLVQAILDNRELSVPDKARRALVDLSTEAPKQTSEVEMLLKPPERIRTLAQGVDRFLEVCGIEESDTPTERHVKMITALQAAHRRYLRRGCTPIYDQSPNKEERAEMDVLSEQIFNDQNTHLAVCSFRPLEHHNLGEVIESVRQQMGGSTKVVHIGSIDFGKEPFSKYLQIYGPEAEKLIRSQEVRGIKRIPSELEISSFYDLQKIEASALPRKLAGNWIYVLYGRPKEDNEQDVYLLQRKLHEIRGKPVLDSSVRGRERGKLQSLVPQMFSNNADILWATVYDPLRTASALLLKQLWSDYQIVDLGGGKLVQGRSVPSRHVDVLRYLTSKMHVPTPPVEFSGRLDEPVANLRAFATLDDLRLMRSKIARFQELEPYQSVDCDSILTIHEFDPRYYQETWFSPFIQRLVGN